MSGRTGAAPRRSPAERAHPAGGGANTVAGYAMTWFCPQSAAPVPVPPSHHQGLSMADEWPLRSYLELGPLPGAVPCARLHARHLLWEWRLTRFTERVELLGAWISPIDKMLSMRLLWRV